MKKTVFLMAAAVLFSGSVLMAQTPAQTPATGKQTVKHEAARKDVKSDVKGIAKNTKQIKNDKQNLQTAKAENNKKAEVKSEAKLKVDKAQRHHDAKDLRKDVKKPDSKKR